MTFCFQFVNSQTADTSKYLMYFPFEDNLTDASTNSVGLSPKTASVIDTYETGQFGKAALFNSKPYITTGSTFDAGESFSILMWVKFNSKTSAAGTPKLIHQEDQGATSTFLGGRPLQLNGTGLFNTSFGEKSANSLASPELDTWTHIAIVMDKGASTVKMYVNGVINQNQTIGNPILVDEKNNSAQLSVGVQKNSTTNGLLDGYLDDFVITSEVLSEATINNLMNNGVASGGLVLSTENKVKNEIDYKVYKVSESALKIDTSVDVKTFSIMNTLGQVVSSGTIENKIIPINTLEKGVYILKFYLGSIEVTKKILI